MMIDIWSWINANSGAITGLSTVVLVAITAIYVVLTRDMLKESRKHRHAASRPEVSVCVVQHPFATGFLNMVVENIGQTPAFAVRLVPSTSFSISRNSDLQDLGLVQNGISVLAPHQKIEFFLRSTFDDFEELMSTQLDMAVTWEDRSGERFERTCPIRFDHLRNLPQVGEDPNIRAAKALESVSKNLDSLGQGHRKPKVIIYTPEEIDRENRVGLLYTRMRQLDGPSLKKVEAYVTRILNKQTKE